MFPFRGPGIQIHRSPGPEHPVAWGPTGRSRGDWGAVHSRGERVMFRPNLSPNETLGRYATPTGRTLEKCKRHRQIRGKLE